VTNPSNGGPNISIGGGFSGQLVVGDHNRVSETNVNVSGVLSAVDQETLRQVFASLTSQVEAEAPPEVRHQALERVAELQGAITAKQPDVSRMDAVWKWFRANVPKLAGAVVGVVVNPIVGKVVEAAGEVATSEFRRRFGQPDNT
jgi:hypothetical protein